MINMYPMEWTSSINCVISHYLIELVWVPHLCPVLLNVVLACCTLGIYKPPLIHQRSVRNVGEHLGSIMSTQWVALFGYYTTLIHTVTRLMDSVFYMNSKMISRAVCDRIIICKL